MNRLTPIIIATLFASHCMAATISVTPANYAAAIAASNVGDTISFAAGSYALATNPTGPAVTWPTGRHYVGNGAVISLIGGIGDSACREETIKLVGSSAVTEFTGFVVTDAQIDCQTGTFNVHDNTFRNGVLGIFVAGQSGSFNHNVFTQLSGGGIYGYPGNSDTYDNNAFDYVFEPIHLVSTSNAVDVGGNYITHPTRIGIELQNAMTNLTVKNNWISDWLPNSNAATDNHMAISCATMHGSNITISGNDLIQDGPTENANVGIGWKSAIEIMGDAGVTIANNYCWNWSFMVLNGSGPAGYTSTRNTEIGGALVGTDNVGGAYTIGQPHSTADQLFALGTGPAIPAPPGNSTTQPATAPTTAPTLPPALPPAIAETLGPGLGTLDLTFAPLPVPATLTIYPTGATADVVTFQLPAGATACEIGTIPSPWTVSGSIGSQSFAPINVTGGPTGGVTFAPTLNWVTAPTPPVTPPVPTQPTTAPITVNVGVTATSVDGGKTFTVSTTQP